MNFGDISPKSVTVNTEGFTKGRIKVTIGSPGGKCIASLCGGQHTVELHAEAVGKQALYFTFMSEDKDADVCVFDTFTFDR